ncbi:MAG: hypothetical protein U9Q20_03035 [Campylobacterota bacterium]|nr:hypothetical protein [Campylobacterota bacterium]
MLQYTRRFEVTPKTISSVNGVSAESELDNNPILTYCNWNYGKKHHLTSKKLKLIIKEFDSTKIPYYVRVFNETPIATIQYFIDSSNLSDNDLKDIWLKISNIRGLRLRNNFWQEYNSLRAS